MGETGEDIDPATPGEAGEEDVALAARIEAAVGDLHLPNSE